LELAGGPRIDDPLAFLGLGQKSPSVKLTLSAL
jgi:hypothetical protein